MEASTLTALPIDMPNDQSNSSRMAKRARSLNIPEVGASCSRRRPRSKEQMVCPTTNLVTLHLEHQQGGACAKHVAEERILVFQSNRLGAIAKVIFSVTPCATQRYHDHSNGSPERNRVLTAKIHSLFVQPDYRGFDLGGLLVTEAVALLCRRCLEIQLLGEGRSDLSSVEQPELVLHLDMEEDLQRHNKLVHFYESLGFVLKPDAKAQYLHNNDGTSFRKLPMQLSIRPSLSSQADGDNLLDQQHAFVPIRFFGSHGHEIIIPTADSRQSAWLLMDDSKGSVLFRSSRGGFLEVNPDDHSTLLCSKHAQSELASRFRLVKVATDSFCAADELWMLLSNHGLSLTYDPATLSLSLNKSPSFWRVERQASLQLTFAFDLSRRDDNLVNEHDGGLLFELDGLDGNHASMNIRWLMYLAKTLPAYDRSQDETRYPSLRTLGFYTAETFRTIGYPDWVQLVGLIHGLGRVVKLIMNLGQLEGIRGENLGTACARSLGNCECTVEGSYYAGQSTGPSTRQLDDCETVGRASLPLRDQELLLDLLRCNDVCLPDEGLDIIRQTCCDSWLGKDFADSGSLTSSFGDVQHKAVSEYEEVIRQAQHHCRQCHEDMSDEECDRLWKDYYASAAAKYDLNKELFVKMVD